MNRSILTVALAFCTAGVTLAQSCENGVCRINSLPSAGDGGPFASPRNDAHSENECRRHLNSAEDITGVETATVGSNVTRRGLNCDCSDRRQTDYGQRDGRLQAPVPRPSGHEGPMRRRSTPAAHSGSLLASGDFGRRAVSPYRPVVHTITTVKWHSDIGEAAAMARQSGRPMLIRISADWCSYCQKMKRETFADFRVVRDINQNFITVDLDADTNGSIVKQLRITSLPTVLVVSPDLRILAREEGFRSAAQIGRLMHRHMQRAQLETGFTIASR